MPHSKNRPKRERRKPPVPERHRERMSAIRAILGVPPPPIVVPKYKQMVNSE